MIVNSNNNDNDMKDSQARESTSSTLAMPQDNPPSYDYATDSGSSYTQAETPKPSPHPAAKNDAYQPLLGPEARAGPAYTSQPTYTSAPTVYNYVNPLTGEQVVSLLPPTHPEMICLQAGEHIPESHYGLLGILAAIFWFPLGIGLCLLDRRVKCRRCGAIIDEGVCG